MLTLPRGTTLMFHERNPILHVRNQMFLGHLPRCGWLRKPNLSCRKNVSRRNKSYLKPETNRYLQGICFTFRKDWLLPLLILLLLSHQCFLKGNLTLLKEFWDTCIIMWFASASQTNSISGYWVICISEDISKDIVEEYACDCVEDQSRLFWEFFQDISEWKGYYYQSRQDEEFIGWPKFSFGHFFFCYDFTSGFKFFRIRCLSSFIDLDLVMYAFHSWLFSFALIFSLSEMLWTLSFHSILSSLCFSVVGMQFYLKQLSL